jgi:prolyl oligopeptidase
MSGARALLAMLALAALAGEGAWGAESAAPGTAAWLQEEAAQARATLDRIPGRPALLARIRALSGASTSVRDIAVEAGRVFYLESAPGRDTPALCVRDGFAGRERVLADPRRRADGSDDAAIDWFSAAPDGRHVAFGLSRGGTADSVLHVLDVEDGRDLPLEIDRARLNRHLAWSPDGRSFYYARLPEDAAGARGDAHARIYRHVLGRETARDEVVFAPGVGGALDVPERSIPWIVLPAESRYAFAVVATPHDRDIAVHVALQRDLASGRPRWRKIVGAGDEVMAIEAGKNDVYLLSRRDAPRHRILRLAAGAEGLAGARVLVPEGDAVIESMGLARDALYLRTMVAGVDRLERVRLGFLGGPGTREFVRMPFDVAIAEIVADPRRAGAYLRLEGWVQPPAVVEVDARTGDVRDTRLQPGPAADFSAIDEVRLYAPAADGTRIPITLLYRKSTRLTRDNPTLLLGYGSYGDSQSPRYDPARLAWLEQGGVFAVAHVRGGGEYGDTWHDAGRGAAKRNTVDDFIVACEFLEQYGFTNRNRLAIDGAGAGGIPVGGALVRRPDLFAALIARDPLLDPLALEAGPELAAFGSAATAEDRERIRAISPYAQVREGMPYPGVLIAVGMNDPDADPAQAARMAARLQQATTSGNPVLLRVDFAGGDPLAASGARREEALADIYAFALWQLGDARFQPGPRPPPAAPTRPAPG